MKTKNAVRLALVLTGAYDIPGKFITICGFDAYGHPIQETIPEVDWLSLERDANRIIKTWNGPHA